MRKSTPEYEETLRNSTACLFDEFLRWNEVQGALKAKGYPNNHYSDREVARERNLYRAIAERFVLEDVDYSEWQWFETPWAGIDSNTGEEACIIDFVTTDETAGWGILAFYVTRNCHFCYAIPLAEMPAPGGGLSTYQANCIQDALDASKWINAQMPAEEEGDHHDEA